MANTFIYAQIHRFLCLLDYKAEKILHKIQKQFVKSCVSKEIYSNGEALLENLFLILLEIHTNILRISAAVSTIVQLPVILTHIFTQGKSTCLHAN